MNWILASMLMVFSATVLYLAVRKASLLKIPTSVNNLAMFIFPFIAFIIIGVSTGQNYSLSFVQISIIVFASIVFSCLGNVFSLKSIEHAPNPGYSLVLSKSYVVFTTIIAVILFNDALSVQKVSAILLIILFSAVIMITPTKSTNAGSILWIPFALGAFFCWGFLTLIAKYLFLQGIPVIVFLSYVCGIVTLCILIEIWRKKISVKQTALGNTILFLIGICAIIFNFTMFEAIRTAPNVGYVNAINAASIASVTLASICLFKDEFSLKKFIGVMGVTIGLWLLLL